MVRNIYVQKQKNEWEKEEDQQRWENKMRERSPKRDREGDPEDEPRVYGLWQSWSQGEP